MITVLAAAFGVLVNHPICRPTHPAPRRWEKEGKSRSVGRPSKGYLEEATRIPEDGTYVKVLPARHRARHLNYASDEMADALERAGEAVAKKFPGAILWIGNTAGPDGGSLSPYSVSHQTGLDADLALYVYDKDGKLASPEDLLPLDETGYSFDGSVHLAVDMEWELIAALLSDSEIEVKYLFLYTPLRDMVMDYAKKNGASSELLAKADKLLFQPRDAGPHADHLHLRIKCPEREKDDGCEN